jgi:hypothetical protein
MSTLSLKLGKTYDDAKNRPVKMVHEFTPNEAEYARGFRFRGDDGFSYTEDGRIVGHLRGVHIMQCDAADLVCEKLVFAPVPLQIVPGNFYRNHLGIPVLITLEISPDTRWYKKGFRFGDHRGSFYTDSGSVKSKIFGKLDLVEQVESTALSDAEMNLIHNQTHANIRRLSQRDAIRSFFGLRSCSTDFVTDMVTAS